MTEEIEYTLRLEKEIEERYQYVMNKELLNENSTR
jgi:hypothetical protein